MEYALAIVLNEVVYIDAEMMGENCSKVCIEHIEAVRASRAAKAARVADT